MRVLHVYSGNLYGGIETFLRTLARERAREPGLTHAFALCFEGRLARELREAGAEPHLLGEAKVGRPWTVWRARQALRELLRRERFDAVICHAMWPQALFGPVVRAAGVPLVFYQHDALNGRHWLERWGRVTEPDLVITNSRYSAGTLGTVYPRAPWKLVYYPVLAPAREGSRDESRARLRAELGAGEGDVVIVQTSRMEEWKGQRLHLEALGRLRQVPGWKAWFAGGAQRPEEMAYLEGLKAQAAGLGLTERVRFLGQRSDVPRLLEAADIHCQPNMGAEPFGIAFVEALQAGLPVVTTAMGGPLEIVDATCGVLVPPQPAPLAEALRQLIEDPAVRERLGAGGPARAAKLCEPSVYLRALDEALRGLAPGELRAS
ncbi:glycosyltransferase family 4 protein [Pyxidicoccus fallax]|uniref:Glycosyltransferase family 4 protein n=1 Tax=Pyxidicoccus fallax TaxID=394095 RepID=A0A848LQ29_9BACT|nr:glycosyltransferase family 4 protein [Pyxidicoccus fallax]NMO19683.1 glycosyltransferase family 4 protein [Pyxidicoccus fallax]NPC80128.1 glycosyltransferase family 4 protein [Pyxidicoccus fallax]